MLMIEKGFDIKSKTSFDSVKIKTIVIYLPNSTFFICIFFEKRFG